MIPDYINCNNKEIESCDYFWHKDCPETCAYARDINGLGVGAMMIPLNKLERSLKDENI